MTNRGRALSVSFAGALLTCLASTGCTLSVNGAPSADAKAVPLPGKAVLGQVSTVDPCSLVDTGKMGEGNARKRPSFDYCSLPVSVSSGRAELRVGPIGDAETTSPGIPYSAGVKKLPRGLRLEVGKDASGDKCSMYVLFADRMSIEVSVVNSGAFGERVPGTTQLDMCATAERAVDAVAKAVTKGGIEHVDYPHTSLGSLRACDAVPAEALSSALRLQNLSTFAYPAGHRCTWGVASGDEPSARFMVDTEKRGSLAKQKPVDIAGRKTIVQRGPGPVCTARTDNGPFEAKPRLHEIAVIEVALADGDPADPCAAARELAGASWPTLPRG